MKNLAGLITMLLIFGCNQMERQIEEEQSAYRFNPEVSFQACSDALDVASCEKLAYKCAPVFDLDLNSGSMSFSSCNQIEGFDEAYLSEVSSPVPAGVQPKNAAIMSAIASDCQQLEQIQPSLGPTPKYYLCHNPHHDRTILALSCSQLANYADYLDDYLGLCRDY
jgi:hypothetical protein